MPTLKMNTIMDSLPVVDNTMCRLCAKRRDIMMPIYTNTDTNQSLRSKIQTFLPFIDLNQNKQFPMHVCYCCASTIKAFSELWNTSKETNEKFNVKALEIENQLKVSRKNNAKYDNAYEKGNNSKNTNTTLMEPAAQQSTTKFLVGIMFENKVNNDPKNKLKKISSNEKEIIQETEINRGSEVSGKILPERTSIKKSIQNKNSFEVHKVNKGPNHGVDRNSSILKDALLRPPVIYLDDSDEDNNSQSNGEVFRHSGPDHTYSLLDSQHEQLGCLSKPVATKSNIDHTYSVWQRENIAMDLSKTDSSACKPSEGVILFSCSKCNASYHNQRLLTNHMNLKHPKKKKQRLEVTKAPRAKPVICDHCKRKFSSQDLLSRHRCCPPDLKAFYERQRVVVDGNTFYKCDQCPFITRVHRNGLSSFRKHYQLHTTGFDVKCDQCPNKAFRTAQALKGHVDTVHNHIKRFECPECGRRFAERNTMRTHVMVHSGEKPFMCDECGKTFRHISHMRRHKRFTHRKEKNFSCSECGQRYATIQLVNMHMTRHTGVRDFVCQHCGKAFLTKKTMTEHLNTVHSETPRYTCTVCNKSLKNKRLLLVHNKRKHDIELRSSDLVMTDTSLPKSPTKNLEPTDSVGLNPMLNVN